MVDVIIGVLTQSVRLKSVESKGLHVCFNQTTCVYTLIMASTMKFISYIYTHFHLRFFM